MRRINWPTAVVITVLLVTALVGYTVHRLAEVPGETVAAVARESSANAARVRDAFAELFHLRPNIVTRNEIETGPSTQPASQLTVVTRDVEVSRQTSATWWGSTKSLRVRGAYRVQAGFDLTAGFNVEVTGSRVRVDLPRARILALELRETHVDELNEGLWNRVQASDVQAELAALPEAARAQAADLPASAEALFQKSLRDRLAPAGLNVEIRFNDPAPPAAPAAGSP